MNIQAKTYIVNGLILCFVLIALIGLCYFLFHNPYKDLHSQILSTSERVRIYYRDQPGYWKLSTDFAKQNDLIKVDLAQYKNYDLAIGSGIDGDMIMPGEQSFNITLKHLNKSACIGLSEMPIDQNVQLGLQKITINNTEFSWGEKNALPIGKYKTRDICQPTDNIIIWTFQ